MTNHKPMAWERPCRKISLKCSNCTPDYAMRKKAGIEQKSRAEPVSLKAFGFALPTPSMRLLHRISRCTDGILAQMPIGFPIYSDTTKDRNRKNERSLNAFRDLPRWAKARRQAHQNALVPSLWNLRKVGNLTACSIHPATCTRWAVARCQAHHFVLRRSLFRPPDPSDQSIHPATCQT